MVIKPTTDADREVAIVDAFVYLSVTLVADYDVIGFLHFLAERCVEFSAVDEATVMLAAPSPSPISRIIIGTESVTGAVRTPEPGQSMPRRVPERDGGELA